MITSVSIKRFGTVTMFLIGALGIAGCCTRGLDSDKRSQTNTQLTQTHLAKDLGSAASAYYASVGHWPLSLDSLRKLQRDQVKTGLWEGLSNSMSHIPWQDLQGKVTFKEMSDGSLSISLPPLDQSSGGAAGTIIVEKPSASEK